MTRGPGAEAALRAEVERVTRRRQVLTGAFLLAALAILGRSVQLQVLEGERWAAAAQEQHRERVTLPARRGTIYDRNGVALAISVETYRISVAPRELRDPRAASARLIEALGVSRSDAERAVDPRRRWVVLPGRFSAEQRRELGTIRGVYAERTLQRFYPQGEIGREVTGFFTADGRALGGVEQYFHALLEGEPGYAILRKNAYGGSEPAISLPVRAPVDGRDVYLTLDLQMQEIADGALRDAIRETSAAGGDLLISDSRTGEMLAAVSIRQSRARSLAAITEPYEPGSTLKPFAMAALLARGKASLTDTVETENGRWTLGSRTITDSHRAERLSMRDVMRFSSNIGMVKLAARLTPSEQYEYLRDFGFGAGTGIEYPAESAGRLRRPRDWSRLSAASLAMGYEISVTPLQLTAAYGALANGGVLLEPYLLREVRDAAGSVVERREPRAIRRVVPEPVARQVTESLVSAVGEGTATRAGLTRFEVAGKTGTARRTGRDGRYESGSYTSSFVGYFPARDPQIVIFVKLDRPQGHYYGGLTAAPVSRETLQAILAARSGTLDRRPLLATTRLADTRPAGTHSALSVGPGEADGTYVFFLADGLPAPGAATGASGRTTVPDLEGLTLRAAARRAHASGLHVRLEGAGPVASTRPAAGVAVVRGDTITLVGARP